MTGRAGWHLESAVERAAEAPETFEIPPPDVRASIQVGEVAKLLFCLEGEHGRMVERMWVEVVEDTENGYVGRLANEPRTPGVIEPGTLVAFTPDHVAAVWDY